MRRVAGIVTALAALGAAVAFPFLNPDSVVLAQMSEVGLFIIAAIGLNVATGCTGLLTLGAGALIGCGAYATALLSVDTGWPVWLAIPAGTLLATLGGVLLLAPSMRLGRVAYAMLSLYIAYTFSVAGTIQPLQNLLHATQGLTDIPALVPLSKTNADDVMQATIVYFIVLTVLLVILGLTARLIRSHWGPALRMVRDDETVAEALGISRVRTRLVALFICSACASLAGGLYATTSQTCVETCSLSVATFSLTLSIFLISAVVVGGRGTIAGPLAGGLLLGVFYVLLTGSFSNAETSGKGVSNVVGSLIDGGAVYGVLLLAATVLLPGGIWGALRRLFATSARRGTDGAEPERPAFAPLPEYEGDVLAVDAITVRYGGATAVNGVTLSIPHGHVHALVGANGSGKTSLLNAISGVVTPASGAAVLCGRRMRRMPAYQRARRGLARTFQTPRIDAQATVLENVLLGGFSRFRSGTTGLYLLPWIHRREDRELRDEALHLLAAVGLRHRAAERAATLTHGERRLLEVARALLVRPRLLLLDEPAAGLDAAELNELAAVITSARDAGCSVLLVEHNLAFVRRVATTGTALDRGEVIASGTLAGVLAHDDVVTAFIGERVA